MSSTIPAMGEHTHPSVRNRYPKRWTALVVPSRMMLRYCAFLAVAILLVVPQVTATVFLPEHNRSYVSLPARFGGQLSRDEADPPVVAYLTLVTDQPYMCTDELKRIQPHPPMFAMKNNNNTIDSETEHEPADKTNAMNSSMIVDNRNDEPEPNAIPIDDPFLKDIADAQVVPLPPPPPSNDLPVAILVERGMCTFYEKAMMASKYGPFVKYVIIYDDQIAPDLVPMSSDYETDMTLVFVSATTGRELQNYIIAQSQMHGNENNSTESQMDETTDTDIVNTANESEDGIQNRDPPRFLGYELIVEIDGISPHFESSFRGLNMAAYFLAAMSGFLAFLIFFGCLLVCAQCGCITAAPDEHGRIVLFAGGPGIRHTEGLARIIRIDKLTRSQVMLLDEEEFKATTDEGAGGDEGDSSACCAICIDEFEDKETLRVLPCGHKFHGDCLVPWLTERHASCPLCKMDVLKHVREIEKKNKKSSDLVDGENKEPPSMEAAPEGSPDDSASTATHGSSPARSIFYRLRGWSLVRSESPPPSGDDASEASPGEEDVVLSSANNHNNHNESSTERESSLNTSDPSLGVSEIEMETWIPNARSPSATGHGTEAPMDP